MAAPSYSSSQKVAIPKSLCAEVLRLIDPHTVNAKPPKSIRLETRGKTEYTAGDAEIVLGLPQRR